MTEGAALMASATDRLLGDLADAVPALRAVGDALGQLADALGVEKVVVAIDDARLGRQVFCSHRALLGETALGLWGPPGAWTEPPTPLDDDAARLLVRAVAAGAVRSAVARRAPQPPPAESTSPAATGGTAVPGAALDDAVATAAARAVRHGWGFTLVLASGATGLGDGLHQQMRAADSMVTVSDHELALLLPATAGDRVPTVLARLATAAGVAPFSYGLASCPADGTEPAALRRTAEARLTEAQRAARGE